MSDSTGPSLDDLRDRVLEGDPLDASTGVAVDIRLLSLGLLGSWAVAVLTGLIDIFILTPLRALDRAATGIERWALTVGETLAAAVTRSFVVAAETWAAWAVWLGPGAFPAAVLTLLVTVVLTTRVIRR